MFEEALSIMDNTKFKLKVTKEGPEGAEMCRDGTNAQVSYAMAYMNGKVIDDTTKHRGFFNPDTTQYFTIGEHEWACLNNALVLMKKGQKAHIVCPSM